ncbi:MAG: DUF599 domain-containing protein [Burkholderiaceae bacterium]
MNSTLAVLTLLPWLDWLGLGVFFGSWAGYVYFAKTGETRSVLAATNAVRREWMVQTTYREVRVVDGVVIQNLSSSPSFFASTTILIIGGLLAVLGSDKANELVRDLPFAARTTTLIFDLKLILLLGIFVYAFFRFTWAMRQYTFGALLIAAAPEAGRFISEGLSRDLFADKAGRVVGLAAETFNDGLRGYYFAFAAIGWFFSPVLFILATVGVVYILYQREFHSEVLSVLTS